MKTWNNAGRPTSCLSRMTHPDYPLHENLRELFAITLPLVHRFFEEDSKVIAAVAAVEKLEMHSLPFPSPHARQEERCRGRSGLETSATRGTGEGEGGKGGGVGERGNKSGKNESIGGVFHDAALEAPEGGGRDRRSQADLGPPFCDNGREGGHAYLIG